MRATLYRELGVTNAVKVAEDRRRVFARGLERQTVFEDDFDRRIGAFAVGEREADSSRASGGSKGGRETVLGVGTTSGSVVYESPLVTSSDEERGKLIMAIIFL